MARPEGYRKATRLMQLADRFGLPVISLIDTAGAFPGVEAEERGQAEAIARSIDTCLSIGVPNIGVVIGEGGSGGALAIAACNTVLMLEHAIYTVASPEAAASILWRDSSRAQEAATGMKITAQDLIKFGIIDGIIPEPLGGAHRDPAGDDRLRRARDRRRAQIAAQPGSGRTPQRAGGEISGDGAEDLSLPSSRLGNLRTVPIGSVATPRMGGVACCRRGAGSGRTIRSASTMCARPARSASSARCIT